MSKKYDSVLEMVRDTSDGDEFVEEFEKHMRDKIPRMQARINELEDIIRASFVMSEDGEIDYAAFGYPHGQDAEKIISEICTPEVPTAPGDA